MSLEELKTAISELSEPELKEFRQWFAESDQSVKYINLEAAKMASNRIFEENAELFRKLAQ